jgi:hypothetical protein
MPHLSDDARTFALDLAARGFVVCPCLPTKAPVCPHGHLDATNGLAWVREAAR